MGDEKTTIQFPVIDAIDYDQVLIIKSWVRANPDSNIVVFWSRDFASKLYYRNYSRQHALSNNYSTKKDYVSSRRIADEYAKYINLFLDSRGLRTRRPDLKRLSGDYPIINKLVSFGMTSHENPDFKKFIENQEGFIRLIESCGSSVEIVDPASLYNEFYLYIRDGIENELNDKVLINRFNGSPADLFDRVFFLFDPEYAERLFSTTVLRKNAGIVLGRGVLPTLNHELSNLLHGTFSDYRFQDPEKHQVITKAFYQLLVSRNEELSDQLKDDWFSALKKMDPDFADKMADTISHLDRAVPSFEPISVGKDTDLKASLFSDTGGGVFAASGIERDSTSLPLFYKMFFKEAFKVCHWVFDLQEGSGKYDDRLNRIEKEIEDYYKFYPISDTELARLSNAIINAGYRKGAYSVPERRGELFGEAMYSRNILQREKLVAGDRVDFGKEKNKVKGIYEFDDLDETLVSSSAPVTDPYNLPFDGRGKRASGNLLLLTLGDDHDIISMDTSLAYKYSGLKNNFLWLYSFDDLSLEVLLGNWPLFEVGQDTKIIVSGHGDRREGEIGGYEIGDVVKILSRIIPEGVTVEGISLHACSVESRRLLSRDYLSAIGRSLSANLLLGLAQRRRYAGSLSASTVVINSDAYGRKHYEYDVGQPSSSQSRYSHLPSGGERLIFWLDNAQELVQFRVKNDEASRAVTVFTGSADGSRSVFSKTPYTTTDLQPSSRPNFLSTTDLTRYFSLSERSARNVLVRANADVLILAMMNDPGQGIIVVADPNQNRINGVVQALDNLEGASSYRQWINKIKNLNPAAALAVDNALTLYGRLDQGFKHLGQRVINRGFDFIPVDINTAEGIFTVRQRHAASFGRIYIDSVPMAGDSPVPFQLLADAETEIVVAREAKALALLDRPSPEERTMQQSVEDFRQWEKAKRVGSEAEPIQKPAVSQYQAALLKEERGIFTGWALEQSQANGKVRAELDHLRRWTQEVKKSSTGLSDEAFPVLKSLQKNTVGGDDWTIEFYDPIKEAVKKLSLNDPPAVDAIRDINARIEIERGMVKKNAAKGFNAIDGAGDGMGVAMTLGSLIYQMVRSDSLQQSAAADVSDDQRRILEAQIAVGILNEQLQTGDMALTVGKYVYGLRKGKQFIPFMHRLANALEKSGSRSVLASARSSRVLMGSKALRLAGPGTNLGISVVQISLDIAALEACDSQECRESAGITLGLDLGMAAPMVISLGASALGGKVISVATAAAISSAASAVAIPVALVGTVIIIGEQFRQQMKQEFKANMGFWQQIYDDLVLKNAWYVKEKTLNLNSRTIRVQEFTGQYTYKNEDVSPCMSRTGSGCTRKVKVPVMHWVNKEVKRLAPVTLIDFARREVGYGAIYLHKIRNGGDLNLGESGPAIYRRAMVGSYFCHKDEGRSEAVFNLLGLSPVKKFLGANLNLPSGRIERVILPSTKNWQLAQWDHFTRIIDGATTWGLGHSGRDGWKLLMKASSLGSEDQPNPDFLFAYHSLVPEVSRGYLGGGGRNCNSLSSSGERAFLLENLGDESNIKPLRQTQNTTVRTAGHDQEFIILDDKTHYHFRGKAGHNYTVVILWGGQASFYQIGDEQWTVVTPKGNKRLRLSDYAYSDNGNVISLRMTTARGVSGKLTFHGFMALSANSNPVIIVDNEPYRRRPVQKSLSVGVSGSPAE